jgi:hypothetical protein
METALLPFSETMTDLKELRCPAGQEAFHAEFRRRLQPPVFTGKGKDFGFRNQGRQPQGGIDLKIAGPEEKRTDSAKK